MSGSSFRRDPSLRGERGAALPSQTRVAAKQWAVHAVVVAIGLWGAFQPTITSGFARLQTDPGDTLLNHYILEHSWQCLSRTDYVGTLWSPPCFAPEPLTLAYSENLLGTAPLYWLLRIACPDVLAFQLWMILIVALTYAAAACTFERLGVASILAAFGAYGIAFCLPRLTQIGHQQLLPAMFTPLAILAAIRFFESPSVAAFAGVLAASAAQLWAGIYLGWFLALGLAVFAIVRIAIAWPLFRRIGAFQRRSWPAVIGLIVAWAATLWVLFEPYVEANRGFHRSYSEVREYLPRPSTWLASAPQGFWYDVLPAAVRESNSELWIFPGFATIAVGVAVLLRRQPAALSCVLTALILALLALRIEAWSAWRTVYQIVPGTQGIRVVSRIWTTVVPFALIGALPALDRILGRGRWAAGFSATLLVAMIAEQWPWRGELPSFEVAPWQTRIVAAERKLTPKRLTYVELTPGLTAYQGQLIAMWAGLRANTPVINGYSGRYPNGYADWSHTWSDVELQGWLVGKKSGTVQVIRP